MRLRQEGRHDDLHLHGNHARHAIADFRFWISNSGLLPLIMRALLALLICCGTSVLAAEKPNLVVFICDDLGSLDTQPYGATDIRTSNVQRLANEGLKFTQAFVASPSCAPSRAALLTGLMPARNGAEPN